MSRNKNEKKKFASRKFKMGSFQTITMVIDKRNQKFKEQ